MTRAPSNLSLIAAALATLLGAGPLPYAGVNLSGGEFGPGPRPGVPRVYGRDYVYPSPAEVDAVVRHGMTIVRLPFLWETVQPDLGHPLDTAAMKRLAAVVASITDRRCVALLDPHNYDRHYGKLAAAADLADLWRRLAPAFAADDRVWFGLMNEPHDVAADQWLRSANAAIAAVRSAGAKNMALVPGTAWTGAHSWAASGNAAAMLNVVDPADRFAFEVHQYLDPDSSGTKPDVVGPTVGSQRIAAFTDWCRAHHRRAFLGEFAAADSPVGHAAVDDLLAHMEAAPDVWVGWTWWAAGPWWGDYMFSIEPRPDGTDRPQMSWLATHLRPVGGRP